jgi:hypothetical protein
LKIQIDIQSLWRRTEFRSNKKLNNSAIYNNEKEEEIRDFEGLRKI